jgi:alkylation response protein AidB-like acyl-CoA dehydrogenase
VNIGRRHLPLNGAFQNGPNSGKDVFVPLDWIIGGRDYAGKGWMMLMNSLAAGRSISLPASSAGGAKALARATGAYARVRSQFKTPIGKLEGVEEALGRIAANAYMMDATRVMTAGAVDQGEKPSVISAIAKYHMTERARACVNDAMDIHGGKGICRGVPIQWVWLAVHTRREHTPRAVSHTSPAPRRSHRFLTGLFTRAEIFRAFLSEIGRRIPVQPVSCVRTFKDYQAVRSPCHDGTSDAWRSATARQKDHHP